MLYETPSGVSVHSGFPNAATDKSLQTIDLNKLLIKNSVSTYMMKIAGEDWRENGIFSGDIVLIDRSLSPSNNDLVAWWAGDSFGLSIKTKLPSGTQVWGVVTSVIHRYRWKK